MDLYEDAVEYPYLLGLGRHVLTTPDLRRVSRQAVTRRLQRGRVFRPTRGAYVFGPAAVTLVEAAKAALLVSPPGSALAFHTAATLLGFGLNPSPLVHLVVPPGSAAPQRRGIYVHQTVVPYEVIEVSGLLCTAAARTAIDLARVLPRLEALPVLDAALFTGRCHQSDLVTEAGALAGFRGAKQARELAALADPRPQCRQESQLRLILHDGGLTGFIPQLAVAGYRLDLGDPTTKVGAEYDGASHLAPARQRADRARHNVLASLGWRMRYFTARDLYVLPHQIAPTVRAASGGPS